MVRFQIESQLLRQSRFAARENRMGPFWMMPEAAGEQANASSPRRKTNWRQADIRRAISAAEQAGLKSYRVEIGTDGTVSIIVGAPAESDAGPPPR